MSTRARPSREQDSITFDDLSHIFNVWKREDLTNKDVRDVTAHVRRLLVYGDLFKVAAPRGIRIAFRMPDNNALVAGAESGRLIFWQSGGAITFGCEVRGWPLQEGRDPVPELASWDPERLLDAKPDQFMNQPVFFLGKTYAAPPVPGALGQYATRKDVINYVANKAGVAHFDLDRTGVNEMLGRIRTTVICRKTPDGRIGFGLDVNGFKVPDDDFAPRPDSLDPVFTELLATCRWMSESPALREVHVQLKSDLRR